VSTSKQKLGLAANTRQNGTFCREFEIPSPSAAGLRGRGRDFGADVGLASGRLVRFTLERTRAAIASSLRPIVDARDPCGGETQRGFAALVGKAARPQPAGWYRGAARPGC
jgi:hypothetical protein